MNAKDLLHDVNNELEIIIGAAKTMSYQTEDVSSRERCALIESAVYKISARLNSYFKTLIAAEMDQGGNSHPQSRAHTQVEPSPSPKAPWKTSLGS